MPYFVYISSSLALSYCLLLLFQRVKTQRSHAKRAEALGCKPPHARGQKLPLGIDNVMRLIEADRRGQVPNEIEKIFREQGTYTFEQSILGIPQIATADPRNIQAILATQFSDFEIGALRRLNFAPMLGVGIFTGDGEVWEHSRALLRPQFSRDQVADLNLEETHVQHMFRHLSTQSGWTPQIDLSPLFFRLTIDSATEFLFGQSIQSQIPPSEKTWMLNEQFNSNSLADAFDRGTAVLGVRSRLSDFYWLYSPKQFEKDCQQVHQFADHYVSLALQQADEPVDEEKVRYVFLRELAKTTKDPIELRSQLLNILLAGRDTTAGLLGWTCWSLARHPAIYNKLRTLILEAFGTYNKPRAITFSSLKACTYLQYVMKEALRLFPSVPLNVRQATRDTTIPLGGGPDGTSPVYVKKGQEVGYSVYVMQRREDIWGKDAAIFNPDRWADKKVGWEYLPFNGGPRICLGQQFALTEVGYVLTRLIQKFDRMENCEDQIEPIHHYSVTSAPKQVLVRLHEADS